MSRQKAMATNPESPSAKPITQKKALGSLCQGSGTFMPKTLETKVGMASKMVVVVRNRTTALTLFEITEANVPIMEVKMFVVMWTDLVGFRTKKIKCKKNPVSKEKTGRFNDFQQPKG